MIVLKSCLMLSQCLLQVMKTEFVPKLVATVTTCCAIYLILKVSANLLTVKTLASVGYFDTLVRFYILNYDLNDNVFNRDFSSSYF